MKPTTSTSSSSKRYTKKQQKKKSEDAHGHKGGSDSSSEDEFGGADAILGQKEANLRIGVAGALQLAAAKGYLEDGAGRNKDGQVVKLKHLQSQKCLEDKYSHSSQ